jgi:hypothetical protein
MRFEVNVDDGNGLNTLHKARNAFNEAGGNAPDMPSYVQSLMDQAVAVALAGTGQPTTLSDALSKISQLEAAKAALEQEVAAQEVAVLPAKQNA